MQRGRQSLGFALDIGTQIPTAGQVLESLRGVAWLLAKLRKGRTWAEVGRKMPVFDKNVYDVTALWPETPLVEAVSGCRAAATWLKPTVSWQAQKQAVYPSTDRLSCCLRRGRQKPPCYR